MARLSSASPTGWVDPMTPEDWKAFADWGESLRRREIKRQREIERAAAKAAEKETKRVATAA